MPKGGGNTSKMRGAQKRRRTEMKGLRRMEMDGGEVEEMKSEAAQEEEESGGGGQAGMSRDPYFDSLQGESGRQKNLSACT